MYRILLLGAGKIGRMITRFLLDSGDFEVTISDADPKALERVKRQNSVATTVVNASDATALRQAMQGHQVVISALSFSYTPQVAEAALETGISYFDLTEDVQATARVRTIAERAKSGQIFMPQCGLAPGFISIIANDLCQKFDSIDTVRMRVGALPLYPTDALKYNLTWSTDGLINEYCNPCDAIHEGSRIEVLPLEGHEHITLDGVRYEAFNTSGGLGTLCESLEGKVTELNYKTLRYMGHRDLVRFLVQELKLGHRRDLLKEILESAVPITFQDVVITFCTVKGRRRGQFVQLSDARKVYHQTIGDEVWSAIQVTTAAAICAVVDLLRTGQLPRQGFVRQEDVSWQAFRQNRFGKYYESGRLIDVGHDASSG